MEHLSQGVSAVIAALHAGHVEVTDVRGPGQKEVSRLLEEEQKLISRYQMSCKACWIDRAGLSALST